jgi:hypothetical protein
MEQYDVRAAIAMLDAFVSVGADMFALTRLDLDGAECGWESSRTYQELSRSMAWRLETATAAQQSLVVRPRDTQALLVQLDDVVCRDVLRIAPYAFLSLRTSPDNHQIWLAVADGPSESNKKAAREFRARVRRAIGSDPNASGATRVAGSLNFKHKYAPDFPVVTIANQCDGKFTTIACLERGGLIAPLSPPKVATAMPASRLSAPRGWPDYQRVLRGAPLRRDGSGPDRSLADFFWAKWAIERAWTISEVAEKLKEVSEKAQERIQQGDDEYPVLTARKAAAAAREPRR